MHSYIFSHFYNVPSSISFTTLRKIVAMEVNALTEEEKCLARTQTNGLYILDYAGHNVY